MGQERPNNDGQTTGEAWEPSPEVRKAVLETVCEEEIEKVRAENPGVEGKAFEAIVTGYSFCANIGEKVGTVLRAMREDVELASANRGRFDQLLQEEIRREILHGKGNTLAGANGEPETVVRSRVTRNWGVLSERALKRFATEVLDSQRKN